MDLKPTTKVAEALALAQRAAQTEGHAEITPDHLASAAVRLDTPLADALLTAAGTGAGHVLAQADARLRALPTTSGAAAAPTFGREAVAVLQQADTLMRATGDTYLALDLLILALAESGRLAAVEKRGAADMEKKIHELRAGRQVTSETPSESGEALEKYGTDLTAGRPGRPARPGHRPRRRDPPRRPGALPAHQEQPRAHRRARRRQDRRRRGPRPADRRRRRARLAQGPQACSSPRPRPPWSPARSTAASSRSGSRPSSRRSRTPRARSSPSSTSCTPSSGPAPAATPRWTPATCSSRCWPAASCA